MGNTPGSISSILKKLPGIRTVSYTHLLGVDIDVNRKTSSYDLGIQQLIEIFRVISKEVKIVILDEPTSSLTDVEVEKLFRTIRKLKKQGISFVYITHKLEEVFEIGDRVTVLRDGSTIGNTIETIEAVSYTHLIRHRQTSSVQ